MTNNHDSGSRVPPAPLSLPASPSQQGEFFFFFFPVHISFRTVQHVPAILAPTTSHCRPQHVHSQGPPPQPPCLDPVGLCPVPSPGAIPRHVLRAGKFYRSLCLSHSTLTRSHLPPRHVTAWWSSPRRPTARWPPLRLGARRRRSHHVTGVRTLGVPHLAASPGPTSSPNDAMAATTLDCTVAPLCRISDRTLPPPTSPDFVAVAALLLDDLVATAWWPTSPDCGVADALPDRAMAAVLDRAVVRHIATAQWLPSLCGLAMPPAPPRYNSM